MRHVIAIDQGTTGSTVLVLDESLNIVGKVNTEFPQIYPQPGWVEHDPEEIWESVCTALKQAIAGAAIEPKSIAAIGITNQRGPACFGIASRFAQSAMQSYGKTDGPPTFARRCESEA